MNYLVMHHPQLIWVIWNVLEHKIKKIQGNYHRGLFHNQRLYLIINQIILFLH